MNSLEAQKLGRIADALEQISRGLASGRPVAMKIASRNPRHFEVHPDAFYGPYPMEYLAGVGFAETTSQNKGKDGEDPYAELRKDLKERPGFMRPGREQGLLVQGWIVLRFGLKQPLTPGCGWAVPPPDPGHTRHQVERLDQDRIALAAKPERVKPPREKPRGEPSEKTKAGIEARTAAIRNAKKNPPGDGRGISG
jgi:hypothetical protein